MLLIVVILGVGGYFGYRFWHSRTSQNAADATTHSKQSDASTHPLDQYAGWKTYTLNTGLSFKYPLSWTALSSNNTTNAEFDSSVKNGYYFTVQIAVGAANTDLDLNFLGDAAGTTIKNLSVANSPFPLYLVAQTDADSNVTGLGLATTPGSETTHFGILDKSTDKDRNVVMTANLVPAESKPGINNSYSLSEYQSQADYVDVIKIFESLTY